MGAFDFDDLRQRHFTGFTPVAELVGPEPVHVPVESGVYAVLRADEGPPLFLERSRGGWWKGKNPTVPMERLEREWVEGAQTLYIGRATSLRERVGLLVTYARGEPVMHHGGRLLWQLEGSQGLLVGWRIEAEFAALEADLIDEFASTFGGLPFANLRRGDRVARRR